MISRPELLTDGEPSPPLGEAHADAILEAALDAVITIDHLGRVLEFNRAAEQTFGYRRADVLGRELAALMIPPELRDFHRNALARWTAAGPTPGAGTMLGRRVEVEAMRSDGTVFPAELAISRVEVPGQPLFTACLRDISDRKQVEERLTAAEFRYRMLVEQLPLISYVDSSDDPSSQARYISPQIESVLGYTVDEWLSTPNLFERSIHEDDRERVLAERKDVYARGGMLRHEFRIRSKSGKIVWLEDRSIVVRPPDGGAAFRQGFAIDTTDRKQAEEALRRADGRYRTLVEQLPLAVYVDRVDAASSNIYTSPQIEPMLGYSAESWSSDPALFVKLLHPDDRERVLAAHARTHATGEPLCIEYRLCSRDGRCVWVLDEGSVIADIDETGTVLQGYLMDITARKEAEEQLRHQAFHDPLTGLANRALFMDRVEHALVLHGHRGGEAGVLFVDLDDFKAVNDSLGHPAGDALLNAVGLRLKAVLAPSYTVARLGGDEFAILVEEEDAASAAVDAAERIIASLHGPFAVDRREVYVTASVGIAVGGDVEELLRSADVAMYRAKAGGKAQYVVYAPLMDDHVLGRLELVGDLRRARVAEEFVLHYQPTVELETGGVVGVEALVRWRHPTRGLVPPVEFIGLAEETGTIVEIGRWVLREACRRVAHWRSALPGAGSLRVSVNVSTRQVRKLGLIDDVRSALVDSGLPPEALTLEITESVLARRTEEMTGILEDIARLGVQLALDDFGTGYSSLSLLQDLPVHTLKIDRSFVQSLDAGPERCAFVRAIVDLADALGLSVVAEGIEIQEQAAQLRELGCRFGQGFYFARPLPPQELEAFLTDTTRSSGRAA